MLDDGVFDWPRTPTITSATRSSSELEVHAYETTT
jgi:hypothetical protein